MITSLIILFIFGLLFWSLSTVLVDRWHNEKWGILLGRSECPKCRHILWAFELIPILSYVFQRWKCKHCHHKIPLFYPLAELTLGIIFVIISYVYLTNWGIFFSAAHILILLLGFITGVYILYDLRYMEIPDQIMIPGIYGYLLLLVISIFYTPLENIFFDRSTYTGGIIEFVLDHIVWATILYSFLYLQILIPGGWYLLRKWRIRDLLELLGSYFLFPIMLLFSSRRKQEEVSTEEIPTWVGGGDLRIALFIWLTLWTVHGIVNFGFAYILGSIFGILYLAIKWRSETLQNQVPFWPFLGIGWLLSFFSHEKILEILTNLTNLY